MCCHATIAFEIIFTFICIAVTFSQCSPLEKMWDLTGTVPGFCINTTAYFYCKIEPSHADRRSPYEMNANIRYSHIGDQHRDGHMDFGVTNEDTWNSEPAYEGKDRPPLYLRGWYLRCHYVNRAIAEHLPIYFVN